MNERVSKQGHATGARCQGEQARSYSSRDDKLQLDLGKFTSYMIGSSALDIHHMHIMSSKVSAKRSSAQHSDWAVSTYVSPAGKSIKYTHLPITQEAAKSVQIGPGGILMKGLESQVG